MELNTDELARLKRELEEAGTLVYITDNAGEIVLDKVFIRILKKLYPQLDITVVVRGFPTLNDATYEDAEDIGLTDLVNVMPNGTDVPGTPIDEINPEVRHLIDEVDLCIAKGQGILRHCMEAEGISFISSCVNVNYLQVNFRRNVLLLY